jgi:biotin operon repressor
LDEEIVLSFVRSAIKSAWSLELLLLLHRDPGRAWSGEALVRELRGSESLVNESLAALTAAGVVEIDEAGARYHPRSRELDNVVAALVDLYGQKPITVLHTIFTAPSDKIHSFADAFLFRKRSGQ